MPVHANNGQGENTLDRIDLWATIPHRKLVKLQHVDNEASTFPHLTVQAKYQRMHSETP